MYHDGELRRRGTLTVSPELRTVSVHALIRLLKLERHFRTVTVFARYRTVPIPSKTASPVPTITSCLQLQSTLVTKRLDMSSQQVSILFKPGSLGGLSTYFS